MYVNIVRHIVYAVYSQPLEKDHINEEEKWPFGSVCLFSVLYLAYDINNCVVNSGRSLHIAVTYRWSLTLIGLYFI